MFTEALLKISKTWRQLRSPSVGEWINHGTFRQWNTIQHQQEMSY